MNLLKFVLIFCCGIGGVFANNLNERVSKTGVYTALTYSVVPLRIGLYSQQGRWLYEVGLDPLGSYFGKLEGYNLLTPASFGGYYYLSKHTFFGFDNMLIYEKDGEFKKQKWMVSYKNYTVIPSPAVGWSSDRTYLKVRLLPLAAGAYGIAKGNQYGETNTSLTVAFLQAVELGWRF